MSATKPPPATSPPTCRERQNRTLVVPDRANKYATAAGTGQAASDTTCARSRSLGAALVHGLFAVAAAHNGV